MDPQRALIVRGPEERAALLDRVRALAPAGSFGVPWVCDTWSATL